MGPEYEGLLRFTWVCLKAGGLHLNEGSLLLCILFCKSHLVGALEEIQLYCAQYIRHRTDEHAYESDDHRGLIHKLAKLSETVAEFEEEMVAAG